MSSASNKSNEFGRDLGVVHEAVITGRSAGLGSTDWGILAHNERIMRSVWLVLNGHATIQTYPNIIDLGAPPPNVACCKVLAHQRGPVWRWKESDVSLLPVTSLLPPKTKSGAGFSLQMFDRSLPQTVLNANFIEYFSDHPRRSPPVSWQGKTILSLATRYKDFDNRPCALGISWKANPVRYGISAHVIDEKLLNDHTFVATSNVMLEGLR